MTIEQDIALIKDCCNQKGEHCVSAFSRIISELERLRDLELELSVEQHNAQAWKDSCKKAEDRALPELPHGWRFLLEYMQNGDWSCSIRHATYPKAEYRNNRTIGPTLRAAVEDAIRKIEE